jgi:hypothetical protein
VIARVAIVAVAVVVLAWLAVMERDAVLQERGLAAARHGSLARAEADFRTARLLNADTTPDVDRAFVLRAAGRGAAARALLEGVVRREPDNLLAWSSLLTFARRDDPATARRAVAALRRLDPLSAPRR